MNNSFEQRMNNLLAELIKEEKERQAKMTEEERLIEQAEAAGRAFAKYLRES